MIYFFGQEYFEYFHSTTPNKFHSSLTRFRFGLLHIALFLSLSLLVSFLYPHFYSLIKAKYKNIKLTILVCNDVIKTESKPHDHMCVITQLNQPCTIFFLYSSDKMCVIQIWVIPKVSIPPILKLLVILLYMHRLMLIVVQSSMCQLLNKPKKLCQKMLKIICRRWILMTQQMLGP